MSYIKPATPIRKLEAGLRSRLTPREYANYCSGILAAEMKRAAAKETRTHREFEKRVALKRHFAKASAGGVEPKSNLKRFHSFSSLDGKLNAISYAQ